MAGGAPDLTQRDVQAACIVLYSSAGVAGACRPAKFFREPMPVTYRIDLEHRLTTFAFNGEATGAEMLTTLRAMFEDPGHVPGQPCIADMTELRRLRADATHFLTLGSLQDAYVQRHGVRSHLAIIAPGELAYGFARMYAGFSDEGAEGYITTCDSVEEAAACLDLRAEAVRTALRRLHADPT